VAEATEQAAVRASLDGAIGLVELCRPPHNLLDADVLAALAEALEETAAQPECRAIVLVAEGRSFSAGGSFAGKGSFADVSGGTVQEAFRATTRRFYKDAVRIFGVGKPMVAAMQGPAIGAGLGLALACDLRVLAEETFVAANFVRLGIHPGFGMTATVPELIGPGHAADLLLTGRRVTAGEALDWGLVDRVVAADHVRATATDVAHEIASAAPLAVEATRVTLRLGLTERVQAALAREVEEQARLVGTADAAEGISAMLQRREPDFKGE
jgi:enoyl-CoA hydratase/carnithine racemase